MFFKRFIADDCYKKMDVNADLINVYGNRQYVIPGIIRIY